VLWNMDGRWDQGPPLPPPMLAAERAAATLARMMRSCLSIALPPSVRSITRRTFGEAAHGEPSGG
jgi:hypothetical protein